MKKALLFAVSLVIIFSACIPRDVYGEEGACPLFRIHRMMPIGQVSIYNKYIHPGFMDMCVIYGFIYIKRRSLYNK
ncbi:MAG: hypothetical protein Q8930_19660 [Bacillota bacterium]|nr:hypothetical protein [Bacillota bacterium]